MKFDIGTTYIKQMYCDRRVFCIAVGDEGPCPFYEGLGEPCLVVLSDKHVDY